MQQLTDGLLFDCLDDPRLIAVVEGGQLVDLWGQDTSSDRLGAVHLARVSGRFAAHRRLAGQLASGTAISWSAKPQTGITEGQLAPVTITAAARQNKPVQAVAGVELAGRYTVLRWHGSEKEKGEGAGEGKVSLSRKAGALKPDEEQMVRLQQLCQAAGVLEAGFEVILRRTALRPDGKLDPQDLAYIEAELAGLLADWTEQAVPPDDSRTEAQPRPIYSGLPLALTVRLLYPGRPVHLLPGDGAAVITAYEQAREDRYETGQGAVLWIEETRAAVMVDIDSAASKLSPDRLCQAVLPELFVQIRLRRLAGKILIDMPYIPKDKRAGVLAEIDRLSRYDVRYPDCLGFTRSGLLELSVRQGRPVLDKDEALEAVINQLAQRTAG